MYTLMSNLNTTPTLPKSVITTVLHGPQQRQKQRKPTSPPYAIDRVFTWYQLIRLVYSGSTRAHEEKLAAEVGVHLPSESYLVSRVPPSFSFDARRSEFQLLVSFW